MQAMDLLCNYQSDMTRQFWKDRYCRRIPCQQRHRDLG